MNAFERCRSVLACLLVATGIGVLFSCYRDSSARDQRGNVNISERASQNIPTVMVKYITEGKFDEAVEVGLHALKNTSYDEVIYEQIADVYLIRAQKDSGKRSEWVSDAVLYADKALASNSSNTDSLGVHRFQIARAYESAGDLSNDGRCQYYDKARVLLESRQPLLASDNVVIEGKTVSVGSLRKENQHVLDEIGAKTEKSHCK